MDLVDYSQERFEELVDGVRGLRTEAARAGTGRANSDIIYMPISALNGDNVVERSQAMAWYDGPDAAELLEQVEVAYDHPDDKPARFPVQWVIRPARAAAADRLPRLRGPARERRAAPGDEVAVLPSRRSARASPRSTPTTASWTEAMAPMSLTLRLEDELDVSRGETDLPPRRGPDGRARARGRHLLDDRASRCAPGPLPDQAHLAQRDGGRSTDHRPGRRAHARAHGRARRSSGSTTSAACACARARRWCSTPTRSNRRTGSFILIDEATQRDRRRRDDRDRRSLSRNRHGRA